MNTGPNHIVIFDGVCALCNRSVDFLVKHNKRSILKFTSFQGEFVKLRFGLESNHPRSILYLRKGTVFSKSTAVIRIIMDLNPWIYGWTFIFLIIPPFIRDFFYDLIATNRYRWFGKVSCRIPTEHERSMFLL